MGKEMIENYYTSRKSKLLRDFDHSLKSTKRVLVSHYGDELAEMIARDMRQEFEVLIPQIPYIGGKNNRLTLTGNLIEAVRYLALYKALKKHGKTAEEIGKTTYESIEVYLSSFPGLWKLGLRLLYRIAAFSRLGRNLMKKQATQLQKRQYPENFVFYYVEGDGKDFDFGTDFTECAVCKFFHAQGADEFTPFLCLSDFPMSKLTNSGLVRTMTLAEGAEKCDFRYKRGREVKQGWPPAWLEPNKA